MSWSYDPSKLKDSPKDQVRLLIGDTEEDDPLLQDEEIQFYLDQHPNDIKRCSLECVNVIITRICNTPDYTLGPYSESNANRLKAFQTLQQDLSAQVVGYNAPLADSPSTAPIFAYDMMSAICCARGDEDE